LPIVLQTETCGEQRMNSMHGGVDVPQPPPDTIPLPPSPQPLPPSEPIPPEIIEPPLPGGPPQPIVEPIQSR
jgi:hypothetical protein